MFNSSAELMYCSFESNTAPTGAGAYVHLVDDQQSAIGPRFEQTDFLYNIAGLGGGGGAVVDTLVLEGQEANDNTRFFDCDFIENRISFRWANYCAPTSQGAGIFIQGSPVLDGCRFIGNGPWNGDGCNEMLINGGGAAIRNFVHVDPPSGPDYELFFTAEFYDCVFRQNTHSEQESGCDSTHDEDFINHGGGAYLQRGVDVENDIFPNPFVHYPSTFPPLRCRVPWLRIQ